MRSSPERDASLRGREDARRASVEAVDAEAAPCASAEVFLFGSGEITRKIRDAVCGRVVDRESAVASEARDGSRCYFCSKRCLILYYLNPLSYFHRRG